MKITASKACKTREVLVDGVCRRVNYIILGDRRSDIYDDVKILAKTDTIKKHKVAIKELENADEEDQVEIMATGVMILGAD